MEISRNTEYLGLQFLTRNLPRVRKSSDVGSSDSVGISEGSSDSVGFSDGSYDSVGFSDGSDDSVGSSDGSWLSVGSMEGTMLGIIDGSGLGSADGS